MPRSEAEQAAWEQQCYGVPSSIIEKALASPLSGGPQMAAMSRLSDAQFLISEEAGRPDQRESARQLINQAKYILSHHLEEKKA